LRYYFDHNATTPVSPEVMAAFTQSTEHAYGNASSIHHFGQAAKQRLESARSSVAKFLNVQPREIVFTSGGTESDNLAILGAVRASSKVRKHVITAAIEHPAVLAACEQLRSEGVEVSIVPVDRSGVVDPNAIRRELRPQTVLISVMHANNETGVMQPIREIASIGREGGVIVHCDGVQAAGRVPVDLRELGVDLYSLSAHKMNAPKGTGGLYVRNQITLRPLQVGGRHERERRAGTENVPGAIALATACELTRTTQTVAALRDRLERGVLKRIPGATVNAGASERLPNTTNIRFGGLSGEALVIALDLEGFAVSSGSACSSGSIEPSHVLLAMGLSDAEARSSIRFSLGLGNDARQVDELIDALEAVVTRSRREELARA